MAHKGCVLTDVQDESSHHHCSSIATQPALLVSVIVSNDDNHNDDPVLLFVITIYHRPSKEDDQGNLLGVAAANPIIVTNIALETPNVTSGMDDSNDLDLCVTLTRSTRCRRGSSGT